MSPFGASDDAVLGAATQGVRWDKRRCANVDAKRRWLRHASVEMRKSAYTAVRPLLKFHEEAFMPLD